MILYNKKFVYEVLILGKEYSYVTSHANIQREHTAIALQTERILVRGWRIHIAKLNSMMVAAFSNLSRCVYMYEKRTHNEMPRRLLAVNTDNVEKLRGEWGER